jgi:L-lactate dehydrogenase
MKISMVGIGHVGSTLAYTLVVRGLCEELVLVNRNPRVAAGEAADLRHAAALSPRATTIHAGDIEATASSDIIVVTASVPALPFAGNRNGMAQANASVLRELIPPLAKGSREAILIVVTNPVDPMTYLAWRLSNFPASRVIGTGTLIDSARFRASLSTKLDIHPDDIRAYVLGEHGDRQFPAMSIATAGGEKIDNDPEIVALFQQTVNDVHETFAIKGYTNYAIAAATAMIIESIAANSRRTLPVSTLLQGYQGQDDVCLSVPCVIGREGIVRLLRPRLNTEESESFRQNAEAVRGVIARITGQV